MSWTILIDALFALLAAGAMGFLAYGGWVCLRHAARRESPATPRGSPARNAGPALDLGKHHPAPLE